MSRRRPYLVSASFDPPRVDVAVWDPIDREYGYGISVPPDLAHEVAGLVAGVAERQGQGGDTIVVHVDGVKQRLPVYLPHAVKLADHIRRMADVAQSGPSAPKGRITVEPA